MSKIEIRSHPKFYEVYMSGPSDNLKLYSKNLIPGHNVYSERLIEHKGIEYREWDPFRSKLAALILKNPTSSAAQPSPTAPANTSMLFNPASNSKPQ